MVIQDAPLKKLSSAERRSKEISMEGSSTQNSSGNRTSNQINVNQKVFNSGGVLQNATPARKSLKAKRRIHQQTDVNDYQLWKECFEKLNSQSRRCSTPVRFV